MTGWVQAVAFSLLGTAIVTSAAALAAHYLSLKHKRKLKRMEQDHEIVHSSDDEE